VVHTGHQTRIMMNSTASKAKSSKIEKLINVMIAYIFLLQIFLCLIAAVYGTIWENIYEETAFYLELRSQKFHVATQVLTKFGTWILIFTNIVPISLIVTLEMVKYLQAFFISWDYMIYDQNLDLPTKVQSSNLNEELGQISHIFSDKTGTLTCNIMEFKKFSVGLKSYGALDVIKENRKSYLGEENISNVNFVDRQFEKDYFDEETNQRQDIFRMLLCLALCHTIVVQQQEETEEYIAQSPDELALVNAARFLGVKLVGRDEDNVISLQVSKPYL
jgi:phospholipid-transporting ATPase